MRIPLNEPLEVKALREITDASLQNEIQLGMNYHIATRHLVDLTSRLMQNGLDTTDRVTLVINYREGAVYLGDICRISYDNYSSLWYLK
jgi:hypothetical protein